MGNNYFCDTGNPGPEWDDTTYYPSNPFWDGEGCGPFNTCCQFNTLPWFQSNLTEATSEDIELRLCRDEIDSNEDIIFHLIEIYVR